MAKIDAITNIASFPQAFIIAGNDITLQVGEIYRIPDKLQEGWQALLATPHGKKLVDMGFLSIGANKTTNRTEAKTPDVPEELKAPVAAGSSSVSGKLKSAGSTKV